MAGVNRTRCEIIADILRLGEHGAWQVVCSSGLNAAMARQYLGHLVAKGFLEVIESERKTTYRATESGQDLLRKIDELVELIGWEKRE